MPARKRVELYTIVEAAADIADKCGAEAVTLASVARKLSIRPPSLFNHINGLPGLRRELSIYGLKMLNERLEAAVDGKRKDAGLFAVADAYLQFVREHPGLYELTLPVPSPDDKEINEISSKIVRLITKILNDYQLDDKDAIHAVRGLRSLLHGYSSLEQKKAFGLPLKSEDSIYFLMNIYITGIKQFKNTQ